MKFIVETDLGHDPDDLFTICHLLEAGHEILSLGLVPGSPEQVRLATGLRKRLGLSFTIGVSKPEAKPEKLGVHDRLMTKLAFQEETADGLSREVFRYELRKYSAANFLVIGPAPGLRDSIHLSMCGDLTMQGGFLPYKFHRPTHILPQFEGKDWVPTFNMNGCRQAVDEILKAGLSRRQFCGKNVCHTILMNKSERPKMSEARTEAGNIYLMALDLYLEQHDEKKMHDPVALVCHLHPEIGTWVRGTPTRQQGGWTTILNEQGDYIIADVNRDLLWQHLRERS